MEILFILIRTNKNIVGLDIFNNTYTLSAYADDTTFFLKNKESVKFPLENIKMFSNFSGLKPNTLKCEICGIGVKRGEKVALCGMKSVDLTSEAVKILGIYYSYNEKVFLETNYLEIIKNVENVVSVWRLRNMTLIGKNIIFGALIMSKVVFHSFFIKCSTYYS